MIAASRHVRQVVSAVTCLICSLCAPIQPQKVCMSCVQPLYGTNHRQQARAVADAMLACPRLVQLLT